MSMMVIVIFMNYFVHHVYFFLSALCLPDWWKCCKYWIGGNDLPVEGTFTWTSDNSTLVFVNWYPGEPSDTNNQDCVAICREGHWRDSSCYAVWSYICKTPAM